MTDKLSKKFRGHWIKVKFYNEEPSLKGAKRLKNVRFCEATKQAILYPVILDSQSMSCAGARYAFGWNSDTKSSFLNKCKGKRRIDQGALESLFSQAPHFKKPFKYIGLNTDDEFDLVMSYLSPEEVMKIVKIYNNKHGRPLDLSLCGMMSVCGSVAANTYLQEKINFSFGCDDSRTFTQMGADRLVVAIPKNLFATFLD